MSCRQELSEKWNELKALVPQRDAALETELEKQKKKVELRQRFADRANSIGQWIENQLDSINNAFLQKGSLEEHLEKMKTMQLEITPYQSNLEELERLNQDLQEAMVFDNRHTPYTMEVVHWLKTIILTKQMHDLDVTSISYHRYAIFARQNDKRVNYCLP